MVWGKAESSKRTGSTIKVYSKRGNKLVCSIKRRMYIDPKLGRCVRYNGKKCSLLGSEAEYFILV